MSDNTTIISDDIFAQFAAQKELEAKAAASRAASGPRVFENIEYTGLEQNKPSILRAVGGPPGSNIDEYTARNVIIAKIVDDSGKQMKLIRPSFTENPNYIINKILTKINTVKYVNNVKTYPIKEQYPNIWNQVKLNGLDPLKDKRAKYEKGWEGREVLIMNVIDRARMDWHREHKHTFILAKDVTPMKDGTGAFVTEGISTYAVMSKLASLFGAYKSWEKYDLAITKTGQMSEPYKIVNASHSPMEVAEEMRKYISEVPQLTDEEKSWERYDLAKLYKVTSYTKIYNRLQNTIKRIDSALDTHFYEELLVEVEREKAEFEAKKAEQEAAGNVVSKDTFTKVMGLEEPAPVAIEEVAAPVTVTTEAAAPAARSRKPAATKQLWEELDFGNTMSEDIKALLTGVERDANGKVVELKWALPINQLATCPTCGTLSPVEGVTICPCCGLDFTTLPE